MGLIPRTSGAVVVPFERTLKIPRTSGSEASISERWDFLFNQKKNYFKIIKVLILPIIPNIQLLSLKWLKSKLFFP
jgi:hypothetical protein